MLDTITSLGLLDWIFIFIVMFGAVVGFAWGMINVIASVGGMILGFTCAHFLAPSAGEFLERWITDSYAAWLISYVSIAFFISFVIWVSAAFFHFFVTKLRLKFIDRGIGLGVGALMALIVTMIMTGIMHSQADDKMQSALSNSRLTPYYFAFFDKFDRWRDPHRANSLKQHIKKDFKSL